jgi:hypothetical protein
MEEKEFIEKYGELPLTFLEICKHRATMVNKEHKITVYGSLDYRSNIGATETVNSFFAEVDNFNFEIES